VDEESSCPSEAETRLGRVSVARHWHRMKRKHPELEDVLPDPCRAVVLALEKPCMVVRSRRDQRVFIFYRCSPGGRNVAVVVKYPHGVPGGGFILTAYPTRRPPRGDLVWPEPGSVGDPG